MNYFKSYIIPFLFFFIGILLTQCSENSKDDNSFFVSTQQESYPIEISSPNKDTIWEVFHKELKWGEQETEEGNVMKRIFSKKLMSMEGKELEVRGYIQFIETFIVLTKVPIQNKESEYQFPDLFLLANSLQLEGFKTLKKKNELIKVTGILKLNSIDYAESALIFENVKEIK